MEHHVSHSVLLGELGCDLVDGLDPAVLYVDQSDGYSARVGGLVGDLVGEGDRLVVCMYGQLLPILEPEHGMDYEMGVSIGKRIHGKPPGNKKLLVDKELSFIG